jgi:hypothetical protein
MLTNFGQKQCIHHIYQCKTNYLWHYLYISSDHSIISVYNLQLTSSEEFIMVTLLKIRVLRAGSNGQGTSLSG